MALNVRLRQIGSREQTDGLPPSMDKGNKDCRIRTLGVGSHEHETKVEDETKRIGDRDNLQPYSLGRRISKLEAAWAWRSLSRADSKRRSISLELDRHQRASKNSRHTEVLCHHVCPSFVAVLFCLRVQCAFAFVRIFFLTFLIFCIPALWFSSDRAPRL